GTIACSKCGKQHKIRRTPDWVKQTIHPKAAFLFNETMGGAAPQEQAGGVKFHCYHCGGALPLDGAERSIACQFCRNTIMVPDDIWVRLHPQATVERWFLLLEIDMSRVAGVLPEDSRDFCGATIEASGNLVIAWRDYDEGEVGHPARIALAGRDGMLV